MCGTKGLGYKTVLLYELASKGGMQDMHTHKGINGQRCHTLQQCIECVRDVALGELSDECTGIYCVYTF